MSSIAPDLLALCSKVNEGVKRTEQGHGLLEALRAAKKFTTTDAQDAILSREGVNDRGGKCANVSRTCPPSQRKDNIFHWGFDEDTCSCQIQGYCKKNNVETFGFATGCQGGDFTPLKKPLSHASSNPNTDFGRHHRHHRHHHDRVPTAPSEDGFSYMGLGKDVGLSNDSWWSS